MTDTQLDRLLRRALLDAVRGEEGEQTDELPAFTPSPAYRRQLARMVRDPMKWLRDRERPLWRRAAHRAAVLLLVLSLGFAAVMVTVPSARAAVVRWVTQWYESHILYRYTDGPPIPELLPDYEIAALPDGFAEVERTEFPGVSGIIYENSDGNIISLDYASMLLGSTTFFVTEGSLVSDITVNGMHGQFLDAIDPKEFNTITWIDPRQSIQFSITGSFGYEALLSMAESVKKIK